MAGVRGVVAASLPDGVPAAGVAADRWCSG
jgi:hypothetical protein